MCKILGIYVVVLYVLHLCSSIHLCVFVIPLSKCFSYVSHNSLECWMLLVQSCNSEICHFSYVHLCSVLTQWSRKLTAAHLLCFSYHTVDSQSPVSQNTVYPKRFCFSVSQLYLIVGKMNFLSFFLIYEEGTKGVQIKL